ncbi:MAG TPA: carboxypeptidase-like regulatory domain-containing protein [Gemmatimonadaceae bacterium]|nr:carboxypeptidase-like regulatory domain-containing protein [Gemmatimonadaceae bacterium]
MSRRWIHVAAFFAVTLPAGAQVTGVVVGSNGIPLPYSTVTVIETGASRFTGQNGDFVIAGLSPGAYHLRVKQLGFVAQDTAIVLRGGPQQIRVTLQPSPFKLSTVTVRATKGCIAANDRRGAADFQTILAELQNNAERERLLVKSYPFEYRIARTFDTPTLADAMRREYDTASFRSDTRPPYLPGQLIRDDPSAHPPNSKQMTIPVLEDLGDPAFLQSHCFSYEGIAREKSSATYRIDFRPVSSLRKPDIEGSVFLDTASFVVRRAEFHLTRPEQFNLALRELQVTTNYREIFPGVTVVGDVVSIQMLKGSGVGGRVTRLTEKQRLLDFQFLGAKPGEATIKQ